MTPQEQQTLLNKLDKEWASIKTADDKNAQEYIYTGAMFLALELLETTKTIYRHNGQHRIIDKQ